MNNQPWSKEQLKEWAKFWQSDIGVAYLEKLNNTKQLILDAIMNNTDKEMLSNLAGRAAGVALVIEDIKAGIETAKEEDKKAKKKQQLELDQVAAKPALQKYITKGNQTQEPKRLPHRQMCEVLDWWRKTPHAITLTIKEYCLWQKL